MRYKPSILIVDDDPTFCSGIVKYFQTTYNVMQCGSLDELDQTIPSISLLEVALIDL
ncbi:MAG: hypothetical protein AAFO96_25790 [Bacteroidota bacterium]